MTQSVDHQHDNSPSLYDLEAMEAYRKRYQLHPDKVRRFRYALFQLHQSIAEASSRLGVEGYETLSRAFETNLLKVADQKASSIDGSTKIVLQTRDGFSFETVILRAKTGRTSVCVSAQVGCRAGCPFCATARMGLHRNLETEEILEQVSLAGRMARETGRRLRNVVFMGMGEPLHNELALHESIHRLLDNRWFAIPGHRVVVSTVGVPSAMRRLVDRFPQIQFALSLHSAKPRVREKLIPASRQHSWTELQETVRYIANRQENNTPVRPIMIEYLMLRGINDAMEDADALIEYVHGLHVYVNLIPYNPIPNGPDWVASEKGARDDFANRLRSAGIFTTVRYSMGSDIQAACGQLIQMPMNVS